MSDRVALQYADEICRAGIWQHVLVSIWQGMPSAKTVAGFRAVQREALALPDPVGSIAVLKTSKLTAFDMSESMRSEIIALFAEANRRSTSASAIAIEGDGFVTATVRAVMSGVVMIARPKYPLRFFASRDDATHWLPKRVRIGNRPMFSAGQLATVVANLAAA